MSSIARLIVSLFISGIVLLGFIVPAAALDTLGSIAVHSNVNGAHVLFDNIYAGDIKDGSFTYPIGKASVAPSYVTVELAPYGTHSVKIDRIPSGGETVDITVNLDTTMGTFLICAGVVLAVLILAGAILLVKRSKKIAM